MYSWKLPGRTGPDDAAAAVRKAVAEGTIAYKLTEPEEIEALAGKPLDRKEHADGGMLILQMTYPGFSAVFGRFRNEDTPFTLLRLRVGQKDLDIGAGRPVVLRSNGDLKKIDRFFGLQGVSLAGLDLSAEKALLDRMSFDTLTVWPAKGRLPDGFDPAGPAHDPGAGRGHDSGGEYDETGGIAFIRAGDHVRPFRLRPGPYPGRRR